MELINQARISKNLTLKFKVLTIKKYIPSNKEEIIGIENKETKDLNILLNDISLYNKKEEEEYRIRNSNGFKDNYIIMKKITK